MKKRILSVIMVIIMLVSSMPLSENMPNIFFINANALRGSCGDGVHWTLDELGTELTISGSGEMTDWGYGTTPWFPLIESPIERIIISEGITKIGDCAFYYLTNLTDVLLPSSLKIIGENAFRSCKSLESINLPEKLEMIDNSAFRDCRNLKKIIIPDGVKQIRMYAFCGTGLKYLKLGLELEKIYKYAFTGCDELNEIDFYSKNAIGVDDSHYIFDSDCDITLTIRNTVESYENLFCDSSITNVVYESSAPIQRFGIGIQSFNITGTPKEICDSAFGNCDLLEEIVIPASIEIIGDFAFLNATSLKKIIVEKNNNNYSSDENGVLFNKDKTVMICYPRGCQEEKYYVPEGTLKLAYSSSPCLQELYISSSVMDWGNFQSETLKCIEVSENNDYYSSIDGVLFNKDRTELICYPLGIDKQSYEIPESVSIISRGAFGTRMTPKLTTITIHNNLTRVENYVFESFENLTDVYFKGTQAEWNDISIGEGNYRLQNANIFFDISAEINYFYTLHSFSSEPLLHLGKYDSIDMQFEVEAFDGVNPAFLVGNPTFSFTSSDTNVFQIDNITKNANSTSIEIVSENPGVAILTVSAYIDGKYVTGGQYRVTVDGETIYHAKTVPVSDDYNFISNEMIIDNFNFEARGVEYCNISFDVYNQANCIGSVDVYDKDGNLLFSKAISAFAGNAPTGLWDSAKQLFEIFKEYDYSEISYKDESYSKKTEISINNIPTDGYIAISNDVNSSMQCALYNISKLSVKIAAEILGAFFIKSPSEDVIDKAAESLTQEIISAIIKSPVDRGTVFDILDEFCQAINYGSSSQIMDAVVDDYILFVDSLNIDVGEILIEAAKDAGIGVVENFVYTALGVPGLLIKSSFKMFSLSKTAEHIETLSEFTDSGKTAVYVSGPYDSTLYSNGYYIYDRELYDKNVTFHQYAITTGNDYTDSIGVFNDMEYIKVFGMDLYQNGQKVQPAGTVEVAIPVPEGMSLSEIFNIRVYRKEADGTFTKLDCDFRDYQNGYLYIKTDHFSVYCIVADEISHATELKFEETEFSIKVDEYIINKPVMVPSNIVSEKLIWSSSNESIAKVTDAGYVIGVNPGEAVVTVTSKDGELSASFKVKVNSLVCNHTEKEICDAVVPTCTNIGWAAYEQCNDCDYTSYVEIPATGHTAGEWEIVTPAKVGVDGLEIQKCSVCDEKLEEKIIPALEEPATPENPGDVTGDGKITAADARIILRVSAKLETLNENYMLAADVNKDNKVNAADARIILRVSAKLETL